MTSSKAVVATADAVAIVQADTEGTIRLWSKGAEVLLGHSAAQAIGQKLDLLVPRNYRGDHWNGFRAAMVRGELNGNEPFVLPIVCADGKTKYFAGRLMMLVDAYGTSAGALALFVPENTSPDAPKLFRLD
jgi:PAS domain S-box-containing protein